MRRNTPKRAKEEREYLKERAEWLPGKRCAGWGLIEGCTGGQADTVQHARGRRGARLLDKSGWIPLEWEPCHRTVEASPQLANELGLRSPRVGMTSFLVGRWEQ